MCCEKGVHPGSESSDARQRITHRCVVWRNRLEETEELLEVIAAEDESDFPDVSNHTQLLKRPATSRAQNTLPRTDPAGSSLL